MEIMSWGTHDGSTGPGSCSSCSMTNSFVTNTDRRSGELLTSASADLADYTILG